ncbi:transposase [Blautia sp.]|uniref:transposase n=1 Tax=unclassified Blautia TaxID=2648079 RepID=UPI003A3A28E0
MASTLSNGFVEGTNSKLKIVKRTMYGRCSKFLLVAKLMYAEAYLRIIAEEPFSNGISIV